MKIKIESILDGRELIEYFVAKLKENNIETVWKGEDPAPMGITILVTNKDGKDVSILPDKLKIVFNKE